MQRPHPIAQCGALLLSISMLSIAVYNAQGCKNAKTQTHVDKPKVPPKAKSSTNTHTLDTKKLKMDAKTSKMDQKSKQNMHVLPATKSGAGFLRKLEQKDAGHDAHKTKQENVPRNKRKILPSSKSGNF